jgi:hypothetical protein
MFCGVQPDNAFTLASAKTQHIGSNNIMLEFPNGLQNSVHGGSHLKREYGPYSSDGLLNMHLSCFYRTGLSECGNLGHPVRGSHFDTKTSQAQSGKLGSRCLVHRVRDTAPPSEWRHYNGALPTRMIALHAEFQPFRGATNRRQHSG